MAASRTLEIMINASNAARNGGSAGGGANGHSNNRAAEMREKKQFDDLQKGTDNLGTMFNKRVPPLNNLFKKMGIEIGLRSILKQSQIFTSTVGSIFQILGALVDVTLAPFLPVIVPAIKKLGAFIPKWAKTMEGVSSWLTSYVFKPIVNTIRFVNNLINKFLPGKWGLTAKYFLAIIGILMLRQGIGMLWRGAMRPTGVFGVMKKFGPKNAKNIAETAKGTSRVVRNSGIIAKNSSKGGKFGKAGKAGLGFLAGTIGLGSLFPPAKSGGKPSTPDIPAERGRNLASLYGVEEVAPAAVKGGKAAKTWRFADPVMDTFAEIGPAFKAASTKVKKWKVKDIPAYLNEIGDTFARPIVKARAVVKKWKVTDIPDAMGELGGGVKKVVTTVKATKLADIGDAVKGTTRSFKAWKAKDIPDAVSELGTITNRATKLFKVEIPKKLNAWVTKDIVDLSSELGSSVSTKASKVRNLNIKKAFKTRMSAVDEGAELGMGASKGFKGKAGSAIANVINKIPGGSSTLGKLGKVHKVAKVLKVVPILGLGMEVVDAGMDLKYNLSQANNEKNKNKGWFQKYGPAALGLGGWVGPTVARPVGGIVRPLP